MDKSQAPSDSSLKSRMAKLGTAMLPMPALNQPQAASHAEPVVEVSVCSLPADLYGSTG